MSPLQKTRSDAWESALTEAQCWAVYDRARRGRWQDVVKWVAEEFGIPEPGRQAFYSFLKRLRKSESAHRVEMAVTAREEAGELAALAAPDDQKLIGTFSALGADMALRLGDAAAAKTYIKMALDIREQSLKKQALELSREKFEASERRAAEARQCLDPAAPLSDEERVEKLKGIFGL